MKVSEIDEQFVDIINYLNTNGYRPFASCDGTYTSHVGEEETLMDAYIAFLESRPIMKLMAAFLRDSEFSVTIGNCSQKEPYELYGNTISGNQFAVYFYNRFGEMTNYFKRIIEGVTKGEITITKEEINMVKKCSKVVKDGVGSKSNLSFDILFNKDIRGIDGDGILLTIQDRDYESSEMKDLEYVADQLYDYLDSKNFHVAYKDNDVEQDIPELIWRDGDVMKISREDCRKICLFGDDLRIHVNKEDLDVLLDIIKQTKKIEKHCPNKNRKFDYDDWDDEYEEPIEYDEYYEETMEDEYDENHENLGEIRDGQLNSTIGNKIENKIPELKPEDLSDVEF